MPPPLDDEPLTDEERESLREAREDFAAGRVVSMEDLRRDLLG
jgi:PHD/YefM family antitoxin component YafN of YafNO toxin-antitoxin module